MARGTKVARVNKTKRANKGKGNKNSFE